MGEKLICVVGPTACGKTALGVALARRLGGEVVSADSMQIYRGMAVGTAAPTEEERKGIPHHMIGVADPSESWSAARYAQEAARVVEEIRGRGRRVIVVGGTGLWLEALVAGRRFAPGAAGGQVRRALEEELSQKGIEPLLTELRRVDPEAAERLHPADEKRILRALEVYRETGRTITEHNLESRRQPPRYEAVWLGLRFRERRDMWARIDRRVDEMMARGLPEEVRALLDRDPPPGATALQAIGYKELIPALEGRTTLEEAAAEIKLRTRQYAKRQLTWLRRNGEIHWFEWDAEPDFSRAVQASTEFLAGAGVC